MLISIWWSTELWPAGRNTPNWNISIKVLNIKTGGKYLIIQLQYKQAQTFLNHGAAKSQHLKAYWGLKNTLQSKSYSGGRIEVHKNNTYDQSVLWKMMSPFIEDPPELRVQSLKVVSEWALNYQHVLIPASICHNINDCCKSSVFYTLGMSWNESINVLHVKWK